MGEIKGFLKHRRENSGYQRTEERLKHWNEFLIPLENIKLKDQGARCMDCGIPFCQFGCPVSNVIPDWNDLVYKDKWEEAYKRLSATNNFPEFTGRVCPAPCENSCTLAYNEDPVTIKQIELSIIENAFDKDLVKILKPKERSGITIAIVGSGPAGLACAEELNKNGHEVTVFEKNELPGGLLTFGIPNFKLEKWVVKRRIILMEEAGIKFRNNTNIGVDITLKKLKEDYDIVVLCGGAEKPRELDVPGRELEGVHQAMTYLSQQNRINLGQEISNVINAKGKQVVVIGGGDTGSDCIGTANRQGAESVMNLEIMPKPPAERSSSNPWPQWARIERTSSSHEEGCLRKYSVLTKSFEGREDKVKKINLVKVEWSKDRNNGNMNMRELPGTEFSIDTDLVFLAMGFVSPYTKNLTKDIDLKLDNRGNIKTDENFMTNVEGIFAAGDMRRGQSLVVWAINEGRSAAKSIQKYVLENN